MSRRRFFLILAAGNVLLILLTDGLGRWAAAFGLVGCLLFAASTPKGGQR